MASYPAISFALASDPNIKDGVVVDRAMNGTARGRNLYDSKKYAPIQLRHVGVSTADKNTLETFYDNNRAAAVDVTWVDGTSRSMIMTGIKIAPWAKHLAKWDVSIAVEEV